MSNGAQPATPFSRIAPALAGWIIIAASLGIVAILFTSRPQEAIGQTGPAPAPPAPTPTATATPMPPSNEFTVLIRPYSGGTETTDRRRASVRLLDVSTRESSPSSRRVPPTTPTIASRFIDATMGGQPMIGLHISVGATGRGTMAESLTRAQLAKLCFPASAKPPGVGMESLVVDPGRLVNAHLDGGAVCLEFVFEEPGTFVVGTRPKPVIPELASFYASTGGETTWGPCLTHGFFAEVGRAGTIVEGSAGSGVYIQVCANGVLGFHPELAGTGYEIQPVLASHWVRGENGQFVGPHPPVANTGEGRYFHQTGHNLSGAFLTKFLALGGVDVLGYPITEPLAAAPGFTDQYFQHLKLRMDEATGEITIRPIGREFIAMLVANRQASAGLPPMPTHGL